VICTTAERRVNASAHELESSPPCAATSSNRCSATALNCLNFSLRPWNPVVEFGWQLTLIKRDTAPWLDRSERGTALGANSAKLSIQRAMLQSLLSVGGEGIRESGSRRCWVNLGSVVDF